MNGSAYQNLRHPLRRVGALVDAGALQPSRTARNHLLWMARSQRLTAGRVDEVIQLVGLTSAARRKAGGYSLGMRQRLGIAAAMLGDPPTAPRRGRVNLIGRLSRDAIEQRVTVHATTAPRPSSSCVVVTPELRES